jgi:hypothetical protein
MEATFSSETLVGSYRTTRRHIPEAKTLIATNAKTLNPGIKNKTMY